MIHKKEDTNQLIINGLEHVPQAVKNFTKSNSHAFKKAMQKPLEVWITGSNEDDIVIIKVIVTNKRLGVTENKVKKMCKSMSNVFKSKMNIDVEFCKKSKVNNLDSIHLRYPSITMKNYFTDHYMINSGTGRTIIFMTTGNIKQKKKTLKEVNIILKTFKTK